MKKKGREDEIELSESDSQSALSDLMTAGSSMRLSEDSSDDEDMEKGSVIMEVEEYSDEHTESESDLERYGPHVKYANLLTVDD